MLSADSFQSLFVHSLRINAYSVDTALFCLIQFILCYCIRSACLKSKFLLFLKIKIFFQSVKYCFLSGVFQELSVFRRRYIFSTYAPLFYQLLLQFYQSPKSNLSTNGSIYFRLRVYLLKQMNNTNILSDKTVCRYIYLLNFRRFRQAKIFSFLQPYMQGQSFHRTLHKFSFNISTTSLSLYPSSISSRTILAGRIPHITPTRKIYMLNFFRRVTKRLCT